MKLKNKIFLQFLQLQIYALQQYVYLICPTRGQTCSRIKFGWICTIQEFYNVECNKDLEAEAF